MTLLSGYFQKLLLLFPFMSKKNKEKKRKKKKKQRIICCFAVSSLPPPPVTISRLFPTKCGAAADDEPSDRKIIKLYKTGYNLYENTMYFMCVCVRVCVWVGVCVGGGRRNTIFVD